MTELEYKVAQLEEQLNNLTDTVTSFQTEVRDQMISRLEVSKALNMIYSKLEALEKDLANLKNILKAKGIL